MWDQKAGGGTQARAAACFAQEGGIPLFWRGLLPRMIRIICATFILNGWRTSAVAYLEDARKPR